MKRIYFLGLLWMSITFMACEKIVTDVEVPIIESQVVVFSFLSPEDKWIKVEVTKSKPVYTRTVNVGAVKNASVTIANDGGQSATIPFVDSMNAYVLPTLLFPIEPGRVYTVEVMVDGKKVSGSCIIPVDKIGLGELRYKKLGDSSNGYGGPYFKYAYQWMDPAGTQNYYRLAIEQQYTYISNLDTVLVKKDVCSSIWTDQNKQGNYFTGVCDDYNYSSDETTVKAYLLNTDIHYYEYHIRRLNYFGENPFSEPFKQYNSVNGGLGVVGAFRRTERTLVVQ
jgi:hypothetical protein